MDNTRFRSIKHFERYNQFFAKAPIIQERFVDLVDLKDYFKRMKLTVGLEVKSSPLTWRMLMMFLVLRI